MGKPEVPGRKINERCPLCRMGRLRPMTHEENGNDGKIGGQSWHHTIIDRLACNRCSISFEIEAALRGVSMKQLIEGQFETLKNPAKMPKRCRKCGPDSLVMENREKRDQHNGTVLQTVHVTYCKGCYKVYWYDLEYPGQRSLMTTKTK